MGAAPGKWRDQKAAKGAPLSLERPRPDHCRNADPKHLGANEAFDKKQLQA